MSESSGSWRRIASRVIANPERWNALADSAAASAPVRYGATLLIAAAAALVAALMPSIIYSALLVLSLAAGLTAWLFGVGPAIVALLLGGLAAYFLVPVPAAADRAFFQAYIQLAYLCVATLIIWLVETRRRIEQSLRHTERLFALFTQRLPGLAWIKDESGRYVYANDAAAAAFGLRPGELYGKTDAELFPSETAARFRENDLVAAASPTGIMIEETLQHADGSVHRSLVSKFPINTGRGPGPMVAGMAIDITERRAAEEALRDADRRKDVFIATLSHELRNPLAPLSNGISLLKMQPDKSSAAAEILAMMERQTAQLARLVDDLLDVSRITTGRLQLRVGRSELRALVDDALDAARPHIESLDQKLKVVLPDDPVYIHADEARLAQALLNLLNNASKFTPRGGEILLEVETEGPTLVLRVSDTGVGVPAELRPRIFEMFYQGGRSLDHSHGGLGVGLGLVRAIMELHGGTIECTSEGTDRGAVFILRLPVVVTDVSLRDVSRQTPGIVEERSGLKLLVVDDNRDTLETFALLLREMGHEVMTAGDGPSALQAVREYTPHVVLLDIGLPGMSGYDVARHMRESPHLRNTRLISVTGWGEAEDRRRSAEAGFWQHLVKPVKHEVLVAILEEVARSSSPGPSIRERGVETERRL